MHYRVMPSESQINVSLFWKQNFLWLFLALSIFFVLLYFVLTNDQYLNTAIPKEFNTVTSDSIVTERSEDQTEDKIEVISTKTSKPQVIRPKPISKPKRVPIKWNYTTAKAAYRARSLSKADYKKIVYNLKRDYKKTI